MPAVPLILQILLGALFAPGIINNFMKTFGISLTPADVQNGVAPVGVAQPAPPTTPGATPEPSKKPTAAQTANDLANNPASMFGLAAVGFVGIFIFAQARAAFHEAGAATKDVYEGAQSATRALNNADASTGNISRRLKS